MNQLNQIPWYLPSFYGDIRLTAQGDKTEVEWENLSPAERAAMEVLHQKFSLTLAADSAAGKIIVDRPIAKVEAIVAKAMKRGRKLLSAVVFKGGKIEELHRSAADEVKEPSAIEKMKAAVTVARPADGCPIPEFERAQVKATRLLREFLSPAQLADFERTQSFLVVGGDTGHQYVLTSRHAPVERLAKVGDRSVFDVNEGRPICLHDWTVPAAEELLALKLFLELPGQETVARGLDGALH